MGELSPVKEKFIVRWGEMGSLWGINRASAQIVALLYLSPEPITAEEISATLSLARSTVSTDLRELQNWGIVRVVHVLGDRRDHFETLGDPRELFRTIMRERKRREADPLIQVLREGVVEAGEDEAFVQERMQSMLDVFEVFVALYDQTEEIPTDSLFKMAEQGGGLPGRSLFKLAQLGDRLGDSLGRLIK
jgi:DNA-binding transcriptional regulator GbsR (MarR family)